MSTENIILSLVIAILVLTVARTAYTKILPSPNKTLDRFTTSTFTILSTLLNSISKEKKYNTFDDIIECIVPLAAKDLEQCIQKSENISDNIKKALSYDLIELFVRQTVLLYRADLETAFLQLSSEQNEETKEK